MKIALLDYAGNVISVSTQFSLPSPRRGVYVSGAWGGEEMRYDHMTGEVIVHLGEWRYNYLGSILRPILHDSPVLVLGAIALFSVILELVAALCFGFRGKKLIPIVPANLVTLSIIAAFIVWLFRWDFRIPFSIGAVLFLMVTLLIVVTYTAKFLIYRKSPVMKDIDTRKITRYAIAANTLSFAFLAAVFMVYIIR